LLELKCLIFEVASITFVWTAGSTSNGAHPNQESLYSRVQARVYFFFCHRVIPDLLLGWVLIFFLVPVKEVNRHFLREASQSFPHVAVSEKAIRGRRRGNINFLFRLVDDHRRTDCWKYALEPTELDPLVGSDGFDPLWCKSPNGPQML
jgi:hypothetical protein